jgi:thiol-disulfide isomerase/thioredoxin
VPVVSKLVSPVTVRRICCVCARLLYDNAPARSCLAHVAQTALLLLMTASVRKNALRPIGTPKDLLETQRSVVNDRIPTLQVRIIAPIEIGADLCPVAWLSPIYLTCSIMHVRTAFVLVLALAAASSASAGTTSSVPVPELTTQTFDAAAAASPVLLILHASWCGHCLKFAPSYAVVAEQLAPTGVLVAKADGSAHRVLSQRFGANGFPSFYYMDGGRAYEFTGGRTVENLVEFAKAGGKKFGHELSGFGAPFSPYWKAALAFMEKREISPGVAAAALVTFLVLLLTSFGLCIHIATKPTPRVKQS